MVRHNNRRASARKGWTKTLLGDCGVAVYPKRVRRNPRVFPIYTQLAARYTVPRKRCGSTKVSSNSTP